MMLQTEPLTREKWIATQKAALRRAAVGGEWSAKRLIEAEAAVDADPKMPEAPAN